MRRSRALAYFRRGQQSLAIDFADAVRALRGTPPGLPWATRGETLWKISVHKACCQSGIRAVSALELGAPQRDSIHPATSQQRRLAPGFRAARRRRAAPEQAFR